MFSRLLTAGQPTASCYNSGNMHSTLPRLNRRSLRAICQKYHIRQLAFFGSVTRADFSPSSDVDILVEFEPGFTPGFEFFTIERELSGLFGRKVDLNTLNFLNPEIRANAQVDAIIAYESARS